MGRVDPSRKRLGAIPIMLTSHDLLVLAQAAEFMAAESDSNDRNGRCASYLYEVARRARAEADTQPYIAATGGYSATDDVPF